jgi:hypothetical protein
MHQQVYIADDDHTHWAHYLLLQINFIKTLTLAITNACIHTDAWPGLPRCDRERARTVHILPNENPEFDVDPPLPNESAVCGSVAWLFVLVVPDPPNIPLLLPKGDIAAACGCCSYAGTA